MVTSEGFWKYVQLLRRWHFDKIESFINLLVACFRFQRLHILRLFFSTLHFKNSTHSYQKRYCYHLWGTVERNFLNVNLWRKSRVNYLIPRVASIQFPLTISPLNHEEAVWLERWSCDLVVSGSSPLALHPATHWICSRLPQVQFLGCTLYTCTANWPASFPLGFF